MSEPTMSTEALGDNLKKLLPELTDAIGNKLKDLLTPAPGQSPVIITPPAPGAPAEPGIPTWLRHALSVVLSVILAFIAAKWGIAPVPVSQQSQPAVVVLQVPAGSTVAGVK